MTQQIEKTHIFGECDLDLSKEAKNVWKDLFNICEETGYFPTQEKYGFSVVGPFNIPDNFDVEVRFKVKKSTIRDAYFVEEVKAFLTENATKKLKQKWIIYKVGEDIAEHKVPML